MRILWVPLAIATLPIAACASVENPRPTVAVNVAPPSAPQPTPGYDWHFNAADGGAQLAYGLERSDDLKLGFRCDAGSGRVEITAIAQPGAQSIDLESGGDTEHFPASAETSEVGDGDILTALADADEPVFKRFRQLGWIALWTENQRETLVPHPGSAAGVDRFFALCD